MMKQLAIVGGIVWMSVFGWGNQAFASEYYVVKSRSGIVRIVDHKPKGGAMIVKGPFTTRDEAENALKSAKESKPSRANQ